MQIGVKRLFDDFSKAIGQQKTFLTEDGVRYLFFSCLSRQDPNFNHYCLEMPYRRMDGISICIKADSSKLAKCKRNDNRQELDLLYEDSVSVYCFEFKFHRGTNRPKTEQAGSLLNDLHRLQLIEESTQGKEIRKYLVYVTDSTMHQYFLNKSNKRNADLKAILPSFYELGKTSTITCANGSSSFSKAAYNSFKKGYKATIRIKMVYSHDVHTKLFNASKNTQNTSSNCHIQVFEVISPI